MGCRGPKRASSRVHVRCRQLHDTKRPNRARASTQVHQCQDRSKVRRILDARIQPLSCSILGRARGEVVGTIYRKGLKRVDTAGAVQSQDGKGAAGAGRLISLISNDAARFQSIAPRLEVC